MRFPLPKSAYSQANHAACAVPVELRWQRPSSTSRAVTVHRKGTRPIDLSVAHRAIGASSVGDWHCAIWDDFVDGARRPDCTTPATHIPDGVLQGSPQVLLLDGADWRPWNTVIKPNTHRRMLCLSNQKGVHFL